MKIQDYISYYIGCKCQTPDGIGELVGMPWRIKQQDRVTIHFGNIVNTENSIDRSAGKLRNHGDYLLQAQRMEPIGSEGITDDGFDLPGGVRPILRRLEDMTEEEAITIARLCFFDRDKGYPDSDFKARKVGIGSEKPSTYEVRIDNDWYDEVIKIGFITGNIWRCNGSIEHLHNQSQVFHYRIKQGFDLFGLIDAGLAIDTKTLTP